VERLGLGIRKSSDRIYRIYRIGKLEIIEKNAEPFDMLTALSEIEGLVEGGERNFLP
jgi:hypothetical protein